MKETIGRFKDDERDIVKEACGYLPAVPYDTLSVTLNTIGRNTDQHLIIIQNYCNASVYQGILLSIFTNLIKADTSPNFRANKPYLDHELHKPGYIYDFSNRSIDAAGIRCSFSDEVC